jgi:hypothetical protein
MSDIEPYKNLLHTIEDFCAEHIPDAQINRGHLSLEVVSKQIGTILKFNHIHILNMDRWSTSICGIGGSEIDIEHVYFDPKDDRYALKLNEMLMWWFTTSNVKNIFYVPKSHNAKNLKELLEMIVENADRLDVEILNYNNGIMYKFLGNLYKISSHGRLFYNNKRTVSIDTAPDVAFESLFPTHLQRILKLKHLLDYEHLN